MDNAHKNEKMSRKKVNKQILLSKQKATENSLHHPDRSWYLPKAHSLTHSLSSNAGDPAAIKS